MSPVRTVLLVEDDPAWALLTREAFGEAAPHVTVEWCTTGTDALARFEHRPWPDALVIDLHLPDRDGTEVLRELRTRPGFETTQVVILSASRAPASRPGATERTAGTERRRKPTTYSALRDLAGEIASGSFASTVVPEPDG